jgi:hypothetical protein
MLSRPRTLPAGFIQPCLPMKAPTRPRRAAWAGRINADGSLVGTIQFRGAGPARPVSLPAGTVKVRGGAVCASLMGMAFEPCFALEKTPERSFRGSRIGFAYCDFTQPMSVAGMSSRRN